VVHREPLADYEAVNVPFVVLKRHDRDARRGQLARGLAGRLRGSNGQTHVAALASARS
jgi:hypothetical protein